MMSEGKEKAWPSPDPVESGRGEGVVAEFAGLPICDLTPPGTSLAAEIVTDEKSIKQMREAFSPPSPDPVESGKGEGVVVDATWTIQLHADCPGCGEYVDLLDYTDFWDRRGLEVGEHDTENSRGIEVVCPECEHEFKVNCCY